MKLILGTLGALLVMGCDQQATTPTSRVLVSNGDIDGAVRPEIDGGSCMPFDWDTAMSVCSADPLIVSRDDVEGSVVDCLQGCLLPWGCDDYDTARANLAECPDNGFGFGNPSYASRGCGYLI